jgi:integrase
VVQTFLKDIENLKHRLIEIESYVLEQYRSRKDEEIINGSWLEEIINAYYSGGRRLQKLDYLSEYLDYYKTDILPFRKYRGKKITPSTIQKHKTLIDKLQEFVISENKNYKVSDYGLSLSNKFEKYLENQGLSKITIGRYIKFPKTFINQSRSENLGIEINPSLSEIEGYTDETPTIYITETELKQIQNTIFLNTNLETAKDWLTIGFYTGQRASDLLQMSKKQLITLEGNLFVNLSQKRLIRPC